ncbi:MAG: hypothetical protein A2X64_06000 [Ignavibacteria bacterium GWF2_33_9]|nr:MAG: hypothetical protein A2X64_06000 [Ignavibacteria bacterium GWF2_33_9]
MKTMSKIKLITALTFLMSYINFAQIPEYMRPGDQFEFKPVHNCKNQENQIQALQSNLKVRPYNVLSYDIYMDWYWIMKNDGIYGDFRKYSGINKVVLVVDSNNTNTFTFDAVNIIIDSVVSSQISGKLKVYQSSDEFDIVLTNTKVVGDTLDFTIYFTYVGKDDGGLYLYERGRFVGEGPPPKRDSVFVIDRIAYTMSEPQDARKWMPCNDNPFDKAYFKLKMKVPKRFNVAANGILKSANTIDDSTYYSFEPEFQMPTYLVSFNASNFKQVTDYYKKVTDTTQMVPIDYYVWEQDWTSDTTNGGAYNAEYSFRNVPKMMELYSKIFGEYPYEKYGMVSVQPFSFGGMEHTTMTTINRSWLRGYNETGIAHELAHQWLGDLITCATWADLWINEGGATWSEALWIESYTNSFEYEAYMGRVADKYFQNEVLYEIPIYGVPVNSMFSNPIYLLEYNKASWVYHMLREQLGDSLFFPALQNILNKFKFQSLETIDFANALEEFLPNSPINFYVFLDQWIMKAGHPVLKLHSTTYDWGKGNSKVNIQIEQVQEGLQIPYVFNTQIEFLFFKNSQLIGTQTDVLFKGLQDFTFYLDFYPDSIAINRNKLLCQIQENILSVNSTDNFNIQSAKLFPNPISKGNTATFQLQSKSDIMTKVEVIDLFGKSVLITFDDILPAGNYDINIPTNKFSSGTYFVRTTQGENTFVQKLIVVE